MNKRRVMKQQGFSDDDVDREQKSYEAFARFLRLDDYPNQPEIVEWPMTELERLSLLTGQDCSPLQMHSNQPNTIQDEPRERSNFATIVAMFRFFLSD